ncbi:hypothetical protein JKP88DRAFT_285183 [Tribonema minus]|uniref:PH domain-containing protein n=1 Tax=Tribonema minus TaxID=303371 RepID=A0A835ZD31_9STRA|nr:hypothetical protein JKP88DRAFT_285183 [Tribonema minus]
MFAEDGMLPPGQCETDLAKTHSAAPLEDRSEQPAAPKKAALGSLRPLLVWGGFLTKLPSRHRGAGHLRYFMLKPLSGVPTDARGNFVGCSPRAFSLAHPLTLVWLDTTRSVKKTAPREVQLHKVLSVRTGHATQAFVRRRIADRTRRRFPPAEQCFSLVTATRTIDLVAATPADAQTWVAAFNELIQLTEADRVRLAAAAESQQQGSDQQLHQQQYSSEDAQPAAGGHNRPFFAGMMALAAATPHSGATPEDEDDAARARRFFGSPTSSNGSSWDGPICEAFVLAGHKWWACVDEGAPCYFNESTGEETARDPRAAASPSAHAAAPSVQLPPRRLRAAAAAAAAAAERAAEVPLPSRLAADRKRALSELAGEVPAAMGEEGGLGDLDSLSDMSSRVSSVRLGGG